MSLYFDVHLVFLFFCFVFFRFAFNTFSCEILLVGNIQLRIKIRGSAKTTTTKFA